MGIAIMHVYLGGMNVGTIDHPWSDPFPKAIWLGLAYPSGGLALGSSGLGGSREYLKKGVV